MTELEKMMKGMIYDPADGEAPELRRKAHNLSKMYNDLFEGDPKRQEILRQLIPSADNVYLQGPIQFDYGFLTSFGKGCYANFNFTVVDCCPVDIGDNVFFGPNVSILTPMHPLLPKERNGYIREDGVFTDKEYAKPITIKSDCWIAGNVTICGGVTIGEGCVVGAGSVVTRDIPPNTLAVGNPCRAIRELTAEDSIYLKSELWP